MKDFNKNDLLMISFRKFIKNKNKESLENTFRFIKKNINIEKNTF